MYLLFFVFYLSYARRAANTIFSEKNNTFLDKQVKKYYNTYKRGEQMAGVIHLSEAVLIAIHSMVVVARGAGVPVPNKQIALRIHSSENHIAKVMQRLAKGGLVRSTRGPAGGFVLNRSPEAVRILDIFHVIEGETVEERCPFRHQQCIFNGCLFGGVLNDIEREFIGFLGKKTLAEYA